MEEWGLFNDDASAYTADEAVEAGFYTEEEARQAMASRYTPEDDLHVHRCEEDWDEEDFAEYEE